MAVEISVFEQWVTDNYAAVRRHIEDHPFGAGEALDDDARPDNLTDDPTSGNRGGDDADQSARVHTGGGTI